MVKGRKSAAVYTEFKAQFTFIDSNCEWRVCVCDKEILCSAHANNKNEMEPNR